MPEMPFCRNKCLCRVQIVAREAEPVEMICSWCAMCKELMITTRIPNTIKYAETSFRNVIEQKDVIWAIEQESFRLGLPKPKISAA